MTPLELLSVAISAVFTAGLAISAFFIRRLRLRLGRILGREARHALGALEFVLGLSVVRTLTWVAWSTTGLPGWARDGLLVTVSLAILAAAVLLAMRVDDFARRIAEAALTMNLQQGSGPEPAPEPEVQHAERGAG